VEVESTIRLAKSRIAGFEGREGHRTPCASVFGWPSSYKVCRERANRLGYYFFALQLGVLPYRLQLLFGAH
jgi:hypothetical protein